MTLPRFGVFLLLALLAMTGCKRDIRSGDYGPVTIGQSKPEALAALNAHGIWQISPVVYNEQQIKNPSRNDLTKHLSGEAGVLIWIGGHPWPLRIEFVDNLVSKKWPEIRINSTAPEQMKLKGRELARLDQLMKLGMTRQAVFDVLADFKSAFGVTVGNFVVGYQQYRISGIPVASDPDYRKLLIANDGWQFNGLKDELWYEPFYSKVTIYFRNDRIERIEHWHFQFELP